LVTYRSLQYIHIYLWLIISTIKNTFPGISYRLIILSSILIFIGYNVFSVPVTHAWGVSRAQAQNISYTSLPTLRALSPMVLQLGLGGVGSHIEGNTLVADDTITLLDDDEYIPDGDTISTYTVADGDTISSIASKFGVSTNTIRWANNLGAKGSVRIGQSLIILPVTGVKHKVTRGDTIASLAKKYRADAGEIADFNGMETTDGLKIGETIIIPDGDGTIFAEKQANKKTGDIKKNPKTKGRITVDTTGGSSGFIRPMRGIKTQGFHGPYNAVDIGAPVGTPIVAAADGVVIAAKSTNAWNGGYGGMIIIKHTNGSQSLYAHMSRLDVNPGETVSQGEQIGLSGNTGRSTGPHLHLEFRGIKTPILY
jgi:murein DD-endopeptidase MepM/ murein hydrolase activator NlpD